MLCPALLACLALSVLPMLADPPEVFVNPIGQWVGDQLLVASNASEIRMLGREGVTTVPRPGTSAAPSGASEVDLLKGPGDQKPFAIGTVLYVNVRNEKGTTLFERKLEGWTPIALLPATAMKGFLPTLVPLKNGRFLVLGPPPTEEETKKHVAAPFATYRLNDKGALEHLESGSFTPLPFQNHPVLKNVALQPHALTLTEDHLVLASPHYGVFWIFSLENGALRRTAQLFGEEVTKRMVEAKEGLVTVLNFQPLKDGDLLVSSLHADQLPDLLKARQTFWADMRKIAPNRGNPPEAFENYGRVYAVRETEIRTTFPFVTWFTVKPSTGTVKRLETAPPGALSVRDKADEDFYWVVDEEDRVIHTAPDLSNYKPFRRPVPVPKGAKETSPKKG